MGSIENRIVIFSLGRRYLGVRVSAVREFLPWAMSAYEGEVDGAQLGRLDYPGQGLPLIDLSARLGGDLIEPTNRSAIMVLETSWGPQGFLVESVFEMFRLSGELQAVPTEGTYAPRAFLEGIAVFGDLRVEILTPNEIGSPFFSAELLVSEN